MTIDRSYSACSTISTESVARCGGPWWAIGMRRFFASSIFAVLILSVCMDIAFGAPTGRPKGAAVVNGTSSRALPDNINPAKLWVMPPQLGRAEGSSVSIETPIATCDAMSNIIGAARSYSKQIATIAKQRDVLVERLASLDDKKSADAIALFTQTETLNGLIISAYKNMNSLIADEAKNHGGTVTIPYTHSQLQNIQALRASNPSYSDVSAIETFNARFYFSAPGSVADGLDLTLLPIIRTYSVGGISAEQLASTKIALPPRIDVTLSLTRIGACLFAKPLLYGVKAAPKFGMTAIYEYPYAFETNITASYNLLSIYKVVQESGSSGGLFSSSSWSKLVESNWGSSAFQIKWAEEDPESKVTQAQRFEIERGIKADLLANLDALISAKAEIKLQPTQNPGPRGATVIAEGLEKTCSANGYCAAAAVAFRALDAIFGSSKMTGSVEKKLDVTATYKLESSSARYVS